MVIVIGIISVLTPLAAEWWIARQSRPRCFTNAAEVPVCHAAVVLGTSPLMRDGRSNLFFNGRMDAAAKLLKAGRVKTLIVSGDNGSAEYDEPTAMKAALVTRGVSSERVVLDYAGFRTLDSVVRAKEVFGQTRVIFVSQPFHNARAVYLARAVGMEAYGFNAREVPAAASWKTWFREKLACAKALLDVHVLNTRPRFLGERVPVP
ncbi:MAG: YdcF family protein [Verrucomicrobiaceae bacterium]|nr:YdcF family protein [Verrucomicrobiaceae bacterium]